MLKKWIFLFAACGSTLAYSADMLNQRVIDFSQIEESQVPGYDEDLSERIREVCQPFNLAPELSSYFNYLKETFDIEAAFETGTWQAETTKCLSLLFDEVHTVEVQVDVFEKALGSLKPYSNAEVHFGNSPDILRQVLPSLQGTRTLFYLDAHWFSDWPLLEELDCISKTHRDNCIIVIDDFKVPDRADIPYDAYGIHECSYEYVRDYMTKIFSSYVYYYVIPKSIWSRAKLVVIPKKWVVEKKKSNS